MNGKEYAAKHRLTMEAIYRPINGDPFTKNKNGYTWKPFSYEVKIRSQDGKREFGTSYTMGPGHSPAWNKANSIPGAMTVHKLDQMRRAYTERQGRPAPNLPDVLESLALDFQGVADLQTFEAWASDYGYNPDSREAERIYNTCRDSLARFAQVFGPDMARELTEVQEE